MFLPLLLQPADLAAVLDNPDLLIIDVCQPQVWQQMHIPGAVHINPGELVCGIPPASGKMPPLAQVSAWLSRIGYSPDKHIVAYDDEGGGWAGRLLWQLEVLGHTRYSLLDGGLHSWSKEGHPVTPEIRAVTPTQVQCEIRNSAVIAELDTVLASLQDPTVQVWDARSREEYLGMRSSSQRAGHIPGAINIDWLELMDRSRNLRLLPLAQIEAMMLARGFRSDATIITHCQSHHRSGLSWIVAKILGYKVLGYHGSWGEWGNNPDVPVEKVA